MINGKKLIPLSFLITSMSFVYCWDLTDQYYMSVLAVCQSISVSIHMLINEKLKKRNHVMNIYFA